MYLQFVLFCFRNPELSSMMQELVLLSVNNSKNNTSLMEKSLSGLSICDSTLNSNSFHERNRSDRTALVQQLLNDNAVKYFDLALKTSSTQQNSVLPIVSANPRSGSISSGQPVIQSSTPKISSGDTLKNPTVNQKHLLNEILLSSRDQVKQNSPFAAPSSTGKPSIFSTGAEKNHNTAASALTFSNTSETPHSSLHNVIDLSVNTNMPKTGIESKPISTTPVFSFSSVSTSSTSTNPQIFSAPNSNAAKGFSFAPLASSQTAFSPTNFGFNAQISSAASTPFESKSSSVFGFCSPTSMVTPTSAISTPSLATEVSKSSPSSLINTTSSENISNSTVTTSSKSSFNSNPLASLSSLVSGIEPLKPGNEQIGFTNKIPQGANNNETNIIPNQQYIFKVPSNSEIKTTPEKDLMQKQQPVFLSTISNKTEVKELEGNAENKQKDSSEVKSKLGGALKKLTFDSTPVKSIFGGIAQTTPPGGEVIQQGETQTAKSLFGQTIQTTTVQQQPPKSVFTFSSPPTSNLFGASKEMFSSQPSVFPQKENAKEKEGIYPDKSQIIEISLSTSKSDLDSKVGLEKLSSKKDLVITKVESPDVKSSTAEGQKIQEPNKSPSLFSSFSSSLATPTKSSQNIFGGSSPEKSLPIYEIQQSETPVGTTSAQKEEPEDLSKESDKPKTDSVSGDSQINNKLQLETNKSNQSSVFSFASSGLTATTESNQSSVFSFASSGLVAATDSLSSSNSATTQITTAFSFSQVVTQPSSTGFAITTPLTTAPTTASSTFGFGSLSTGLTEQKSKTGFSFGQLQTPVSSGENIFGGLNNKPVGSIFGGQSTTADTKSIFGTTPATTVTKTETKSIFGQSQTSSTDTKNIFGQPSMTDSKSVFGQVSTTTSGSSLFFGQTSSESKNVFAQTPGATTEAKSVFGQSLPTSSETKSIFGQNPGTATESKSMFGSFSDKPVSTQSIFGGQSTTAETKSIFSTTPTTNDPKTEVKSIFGQSQTSSTETKNIFGQTSTPENKNIFGLPSTTSTETKSVFGQVSTSTTGSTNIFGQTTAQPENKSIFGQVAATTADLQSAFSFSLGGPTTSAPSFFGTPATTATSFFGQPVCSPVSTASSPFGQTTSTPGFGNASQSPFGSASTFGSKPTFGQSGGSFFGQSR